MGRTRCCGDCSHWRRRRWSWAPRPAAATPTPGWSPPRRTGWSAQYADAANSSYTATAGAATLTLHVEPLGQGRARRRRRRSAAGGYLAVNGQTAGGCSLMVWENDNNGRQRWCTRMVLGGGFASPLFDGFDNLYIGQPGLMLSYPSDPVGPLARACHRNAHHRKVSRRRPAAGGDPPRAGAGVRRPTAAWSPAPRWTWSTGVDPTDPTRGLDDCQQALPRCPVARRAGVLGGDADDRRRACGSPSAKASVLVGAAVPPRADAAADQGVDQRRRGRRGAGQPGAVRRRQDRLRQRPRPASVGAQRRRRQAEMVCAAGLSTADTAVGVARRG